MKLSQTMRKYLFSLILITLLLGGVGGYVYYSLIPEYYFSGYPFIPIYFFLFGVFHIYLFDVCRRFAPRRMLLFYMAQKMFKMLLSIVVLAMYCVVARTEIHAFLLTFIANYLIYLIFDTCFFTGYEWMKKHQKKNKTQNETVA